MLLNVVLLTLCNVRYKYTMILTYDAYKYPSGIDLFCSNVFILCIFVWKFD